MLTNNSININSVIGAMAKVEKANHIQLTTLKTQLAAEESSTIEMFASLRNMESIDTRFQRIVTVPNLDLSNARYLLEASLLL